MISSHFVSPHRKLYLNCSHGCHHLYFLGYTILSPQTLCVSNEQDLAIVLCGRKRAWQLGWILVRSLVCVCVYYTTLSLNGLFILCGHFKCNQWCVYVCVNSGFMQACAPVCAYVRCSLQSKENCPSFIR